MAIEMQRRLLYIPVLHIDANLINARQKLPTVNRLERWADDEVILISISSTALGEATAGGSEARARKGSTYIVTMTPPAEAHEPAFADVELALFGGHAKDDNQRNDVRIVLDAMRYEAILVTSDGGSKRQPGGILGNREKLAGRVKILSPEEAVEMVKEKIRARDEFNLRVARSRGLALPTWHERD